MRFAIPPEEWLDLSTGINPNGWPVPAIPARIWNRLPEEQDGLQEAARAYYGCDALLPVAGSQAVIQALPRLRAPCRVAVVAPTYAEHPQAWQQAGHQVVQVAPAEVETLLPGVMVVVVVNPNNPTGHRFAAGTLLAWHGQLAARGGWLVVDEAFMDAGEQGSLSALPSRPGLLVLRSLGKFFGLAGARVGFLLGEPDSLARVAELLGPWGVANPARWVAARALADCPWQQQTRRALQQHAAGLAALLGRYGLTPAAATALFQWIPHDRPREIQERLARQGVLLRAFDVPGGLRCGLPATAADWRRLEQALATL